MAGYGLDDSDFDEFLATSSEDEDEAVLLEAPLAALSPAGPSCHVLLTSTAQRLPAASSSGDACVAVPPSRCGGGASASCLQPA